MPVMVKGGLDGNIWKVCFSPNTTGTWSFISHSTETQMKWWQIKEWILRPFVTHTYSSLLNDYIGWLGINVYGKKVMNQLVTAIADWHMADSIY